MLTTWKSLLPPDIVTKAEALYEKAQAEREASKVIYPPQEDIFRAYELVSPETVRCVMLGQDPYHGAGQAHGLSFSVTKGTPLPRSLRNIYKELEADLGVQAPTSGDLSHWASQGVLLLNTVLTVEEGQANSHKNWGWQEVTLETVRLCAGLPFQPVFILWGAHAQKVGEQAGLSLEADNVICSAHPSPLSASRGFFGSRPFSRANAYLAKRGAEIQWG